MFGALPAYGLFCRHLRGLNLRNVSVGSGQPDQRPSLVCEDVQDLDVFGWRATTISNTAPVLRFDAVQDACIHGCRCPENAAAFLHVAGKSSQRITLLANELSGAKKKVLTAEGVARKAVRIQ